MWSVDDLWRRNPAGAFRRLRAMGYTGVQSFGFYSMDWDELAKMLDGEGLRIVDMPFYLETVAKPADLDRFLGFCRRFDIDFAFVPCYSKATTAGERRRYVEDVIAVKAKFAGSGIRVGFHNHQAELKDVFPDGRDPVDLFLAGGFDFELDVGHAKLAGRDPVALLRRLAGRVPSIHAKPAGGHAVGGAGDGNDWPSILAESALAGTRWAVVECETRRNTFEDVESSIAYLKGLA